MEGHYDFYFSTITRQLALTFGAAADHTSGLSDHFLNAAL